MSSKSSNFDSANPGSTDNGLIEGIRAHDEQAWSRFVDQYSSLIYLWCRHFDLQPADALDVSQQVFQAVNRSISKYSKRSDTGGFRAWLFVVTRNLIRNYLTRALRGPRARGGSSIQLRLLREPDMIDEESLSETPTPAYTSSTHLILESVRASVDDRTWQCFWLVAMEGHTATEVADRLNMKPAAVRQAKYRVAKQLREKMTDLP